MASQVVVVDLGPTDSTTTIARELSAAVVDTDWRGFGPQRRFAVRLRVVQHNSVFFLDADESVSEELAQAVSEAVPSSACGAYWQYFRLVIHGRWSRPCGG